MKALAFNNLFSEYPSMWPTRQGRTDALFALTLGVKLGNSLLAATGSSTWCKVPAARSRSP